LSTGFASQISQEVVKSDMRYRILILMADGATYYELCQCDTPMSVASIVESLLKNTVTPITPIRIETFIVA
jgi:hypothetical protein